MEAIKDPEGEETLEGLEGAHAFNRWIYQSIEPYCKGEILEIGSGIGNITSFFVSAQQHVTASDLRPHYLERLKAKFPERHFSCITLDAASNNFAGDYSAYFGKYDTVFALNVVEHIENDKEAIRNLSLLIKPGGKLIILVPAYQKLYNSFDLHLGHFRRYTKKTLSEAITQSGLVLYKSFYFNFAGIAGWFLSSRITPKKVIPQTHIKIYNFLVPIFKLMDLIVLRKAGLSVICIAHKDGRE